MKPTLRLISVTIAFAFLHVAAALSAAAVEGMPQVRWESAGGVDRVVIDGLPAEVLARLKGANFAPEVCSGVLKVGAKGSRRPMLGRYAVEAGDRLIFMPRFPLEPGLTYEAALTTADGAGPMVGVYTPRVEKPKQRTKLVRVDPDNSDVPENLLKLYLTFSGSMSRGEVYKRVRLLDQDGKRVELPFVEIAEELWDPSQRRITLLFDPGRIKTGLRPREEEGPILKAGHLYTLEIDPAWPDANGQPLLEGFRRVYRVGPPDSRPLNPDDWRVQAPAANSTAELGLVFNESVDVALASRLIRIVDANGVEVEGTPMMESCSRPWLFRPRRPWKAGEYRIAIPTVLEDLAGNSIRKPFEVDVFQVDRPAEKRGQVFLPFRVESRPSR